MANSCCVQFAKFILIFINFIFFTMGGAIAGMAGYLMVNGASLGFTGDAQAILTPSALIACIIFGAACIVISIVGCCSALKGGCCGKFFLIIYSVVIGIVIIAELAGGAVVLVASGKIASMDSTKIANTTAEEALEKAVSAFIDTTYTKCCPGGKPLLTDVVCKAINTQLAAPGPKGMCTDESKFKQACIDWIAKYTKPLGIGAMVIAGIELLCIAAACHISCHAKTPEQEQADEIQKQREAQQQAGGDLAYGSTAAAGGKPLAAGSYA